MLGCGCGARSGEGRQDAGMALRFVYLAFCATLRLFARRRDGVERS
jgi:hypothetical protein